MTIVEEYRQGHLTRTPLLHRPDPEKVHNHEGRSAIVVIAKCPIPGTSKTRLAKGDAAIGETGAATLARAMLSDVLMTLSKCEPLQIVPKILFYAPPTSEGRDIMTKLLESKELKLSLSPEGAAGWNLEPLLSSSSSLTSSNLGDMLQNALERTRQSYCRCYNEDTNSSTKPPPPSTVIFLGMDSPRLPLADIQYALKNPTTAVLCPADDGGYGMLSVPSSIASQNAFSKVLWSHPLTAVSQLKALTDAAGGVTSIQIGSLMHDIDTPEDLERFCHVYLPHGDDDEERTSVLDHPVGGSGNSHTISSDHPTCFFTIQALQELGKLPKLS